MSLGYDIKGWRGVAGNFEKKKPNGYLDPVLLAWFELFSPLRGINKLSPVQSFCR